MSFVVGIDLGTTFTGTAVARDGGTGAMVSLGRQRLVMPSVVWIGPDGDIAVGDSAVRHVATDPANVVRLFKRETGSDVPFRVGDRDVSVDELMAIVLRHALDAAESEHGGRARTVALTFPASWGPLRQGVLVAGAEKAGIDEPLLVTEPEAAAAFYASERPVPDDALVAVFDFGGGTLDIAVLHRTGAGFELLGTPVGDDELGGSNIDEMMFEHVLERLDSNHRDLVERDLGAQAALFASCVEAKEHLSFDPDIVVECVTDLGRTTVTVTRGELEAMIEPLVERSISVLREGLAAAAVDESELHSVLLVGGTSRIPLITSILSSRLPCTIAVDTDPKTSVALGAAKLALAGDAPGTSDAAATVDLGIKGLGPAELIGRGGYSLVYRARQESLDRDLAVKLITGGGFDLTARRRFEEECQAIGRLSEHPHIVNVYESGVPEDRPPYLVMSYVPDGSLEDQLEAGRTLSWEAATDVAIKVGGAVEAAHRQGIFHCDIKPANVLLSPHGEPLLADFGLARVAERSGTHSITGIAGTPHFCPPEVFDGVAPAPQRDVYGLAATTHALITGRPPIDVDTESILALMRHVASDEPEDLRVHGVPGPVADVIRRGLAKDPADRIASAQEFADALAAAVDAVRAEHETSTESPPPTPPTDVPVWRRAAVVGPVAVVVLVAVLLLIVQPWASDEGQAVPTTLPAATTVPATTPTSAPVTSVPTTTSAPPTTSAPTTVPPPVTGIAITDQLTTSEKAFSPTLAVGLLWAPFTGGVTILEPTDNSVVTSVDIAGRNESPLFHDGRMWVANIDEPVLTVLDATDELGMVERQIAVGQMGITPVFSNGFVWVPNRADGTVSRVDPDTYEVQTIQVAERILGLSATADGVETTIDDTRYTISADGDVDQETAPPSEPNELATATWQWLVLDGTITRVDRDTGLADETLEFEIGDEDAVASDRGLWLVRRNEPTIWFIDEMTLEVFEMGLPSRPDTPVVVDGRAYVSLIDDGELLVFETLT